VQWPVRGWLPPKGVNSKSRNRPKPQKTFGQLWGRPLASWGNRSKNKPPHYTFAPFVDNLAQKPDRYLLGGFRGASPRFGPLTRVRKFENFQKILPPQPLGPKVPNFAHWWRVGIPPREKILGAPRPHLGELWGVKVSTFPPPPSKSPRQNFPKFGVGGPTHAPHK